MWLASLACLSEEARQARDVRDVDEAVWRIRRDGCRVVAEIACGAAVTRDGGEPNERRTGATARRRSVALF